MAPTFFLRFFCLLALATAGAISAPADAAQLSIAAVVGEDIITTTEVAERRALIMSNANIPNTIENQTRITPRIVQMLVEETLQLQDAKRNSIVISDEEVATAIDSLKAQENTPETVREYVKKRGLSMRSLENQIRAQIAWGKLIQRKLRRNVSVSDDEVKRAQLASASAPGEEELRIQALDFDLTDTAKRPATEKLMSDAALELKSGADMAGIAAKHLRNPAVRYTPPTWATESQISPQLLQKLRGLKPGETSPPLYAGTTAQLLQVMARKKASKQAAETEYAIKQLTIALAGRDKAALAKLRQTTEALRKNPGDCTSPSVIETPLPVQVDFMRMQRANLNEQQRSIVSNLEVGQISEPLISKDAMRLVMMCEIIEPSESTLPDAEKIRQQLFGEKLELEAQKHLRNLRRDAYIDIKSTL